jgi:hypothetical protein
MKLYDYISKQEIEKHFDLTKVSLDKLPDFHLQNQICIKIILRKSIHVPGDKAFILSTIF